MRIFLYVFLVLTFIGPLTIFFSRTIDFSADYRTANRDSSRLAPDPTILKEAVIQVYAARTFNWRGLFAVHTWIAFKPENATKYRVYQVVGWRLLQQLPPLMIDEDIPDRNWFDQTPYLLLDIRGEKAEKLIPKIQKAAENYPYPNQYHYWPGPNSNTFTAYIARQIPEMQLALPSHAIGKDYPPNGQFFIRAASGTGYELSYHGMFSLTLAIKEGLEINFLGLVYGMSPNTMTIKLPGFGDIPLLNWLNKNPQS